MNPTKANYTMKKILLPVLFSLTVAVCRADGPYHFIKEIPVGGDGGWDYFSVDSAAQRPYVSHGTKVGVIDTKSHQVVTNWPSAPGEEASGMAIDLKNHRLFLGCGGSKTMVMMDSTSGKVITAVPIGQGVDANAFDPGTGFAFASCGDGT